jgi:hypothetical protein
MECIADFHLGYQVFSLNIIEGGDGFLFPCAEGALGAVFPITEQDYRRN